MPTGTLGVTVSSIQLWVTVLVLVLAPLFFGSVDLFWIVVWTILLSASALSVVVTPMNPAQSRLLLGFLALCGIYALVAVIQIVPDLFKQLNDPSWQRASEILGLDLSPRISSRAEIPLLATAHFLLFTTAVVSGFCLGTSQRSFELIVRFAQYSIFAYAVYGLAALVFTPNMVLWAPKLAYRGSLTATFINRNTASTFVGAGVILWSCSAYSSIQSLNVFSLRLLLLSPLNEDLAFKIITRSAAALTCFFALLMTGSRGGLISSCFGLVVAITLMVGYRRKAKFWFLALTGSAAIALVVVLLSRMGQIITRGLLDEARWSVYEICLEAIRQRPLLGAGAGGFADVFPSLRASHLSGGGVWDYAHSTILEIALEMGVPVAAMVVVAALASIFIVARAALVSKSSSRNSLAAIAGVLVLSYLHSIVDFSLQIPGYFIMFATLLGCGLGQACSTFQSNRRLPGSVDARADASRQREERTMNGFQDTYRSAKRTF